MWFSLLATEEARVVVKQLLSVRGTASQPLRASSRKEKPQNLRHGFQAKTAAKLCALRRPALSFTPEGRTGSHRHLPFRPPHHFHDPTHTLSTIRGLWLSAMCSESVTTWTSKWGSRSLGKSAAPSSVMSRLGAFNKILRGACVPVSC